MRIDPLQSDVYASACHAPDVAWSGRARFRKQLIGPSPENASLSRGARSATPERAPRFLVTSRFGPVHPALTVDLAAYVGMRRRRFHSSRPHDLPCLETGPVQPRATGDQPARFLESMDIGMSEAFGVRDVRISWLFLFGLPHKLSRHYIRKLFSRAYY